MNFRCCVVGLCWKLEPPLFSSVLFLLSSCFNNGYKNHNEKIIEDDFQQHDPCLTLA